MSKVGGTYPSIVQGVSELQPQHRRPGQTTAQVNMLSDPVHGLVRRRGTRYLARIAATLTADAKAELAAMDAFDFSMDGKDYVLLFRKKASTLPSALFAFLYCKTDEAFIPINYEASSWVTALVSGGASAVAAIGSYVYIAGNTTIPAATQTNVWDTQANLQKLAAWFRTGKYSTTYKVSLVREDGTKLTKEYTTKPAAYPGTLDTSDIPFFELDGTTPRPEYQKDVNDRVNAYNSATNEWIKEAAEDITPENIATKLADLFTLDSVFVASVDGGGLLFNDPDFVNIEVDDGGDNTTVFVNGREITDATRAVKYHFHGKIIRVRPRGAGNDEAYYLEARLEDGRTSGYGAVEWHEVAGVSADITGLVSQMIVYGGQAYIARNGAGLKAMAPASGEHVAYASRAVGDGLTSPLPWFIGKPITMLSVFQDRLIVGSENYVNGSRSGDYLNFFRHSVLTVADDDPVEVFAHGSEGDVLRYSTLYSGNLIIFGINQQYGIDGSTLLSPKSPLIRPISANKEATDARPVTSGNFIFYAQHGEEEGTSFHQMRVGALNGQQTITDELSDEIGSWLNGAPLQIAPVTAPNLVMFRTGGHARDVYLYRYVDDKNNGQRHIGAWHSLEYAEALGTIIGVSSYQKAGLIFTARSGYIVADEASFAGEADTHAHLDSRIPYANRATVDVSDTAACVAVQATSESFLLGTPMARIAEFIDQLPGIEPHLEYGVVSPAYVIPTNPFPRDQNGMAVLDGRMVLGKVSVDVESTAGMIADVSSTSGVVRTTDFEGRIMGSTLNIIGAQPVWKGQLTIAVGREVRESFYTIRSKDWLPLRITALAWTGQHFNNVRRVT